MKINKMSVVKHCLKRLIRSYAPISLRKKIFSFIALLMGALLLFVQIQLLLSPTIIPFSEMSHSLISRYWKQNLSSDNFCSHMYETYPSNERIRLFINVSDDQLNSLVDIAPGGSWSPGCISKYRVNIVVPYRDRESQLRIFLHYIHRFLPLQEIDYRIFIVEQSKEKDFNRAKLFNIGFVEAEKRYPAECYIFHDVDLIPLSLNNIYACTDQPRHCSSAVDVFDFQLPYRNIFGGVVAISQSIFRKINGHSNSFFGWGGEDDDLLYRVAKAGLDVVRFEPEVATYHMLRHLKENPNPDRHRLLDVGRNLVLIDGLNSLNYTLLTYELTALYTLIKVHV